MKISSRIIPYFYQFDLESKQSGGMDGSSLAMSFKLLIAREQRCEHKRGGRFNPSSGSLNMHLKDTEI